MADRRASHQPFEACLLPCRLARRAVHPHIGMWVRKRRECRESSVCGAGWDRRALVDCSPWTRMSQHAACFSALRMPVRRHMPRQHSCAESLSNSNGKRVPRVRSIKILEGCGLIWWGVGNRGRSGAGDLSGDRAGVVVCTLFVYPLADWHTRQAGGQKRRNGTPCVPEGSLDG